MAITNITGLTFADVHEELDLALGSRDTRKLQHNTYLRREGSDLVIRYHATDVLTYHKPEYHIGRGSDPRELAGTVTLNTDGWHTVTTSARFRDWLPRGWSVGPSGKGNSRCWHVFGPVPGERVTSKYNPERTYPRIAAHFRLWDGITITDTPRPLVVNYRNAPDFDAADSLGAELNAMISEYVALYDSERLRELFPVDIDSISVTGDCFFCCMVDSDGLPIRDTGHLLAHLLERYTMISLVRNAYHHRRYGDSDLVLRIDLTDSQFGTIRAKTIREHVKRYLVAQLVPHGIPTVTRENLAAARREVESVSV